MYAERIKECRRKLGISQQRLGEILGVSAVSVCKWENGQNEPDISKLTRMADLFGTSLDELCGHEIPAKPPTNMAVMARGFSRLTPAEQEKYLAVGRALFGTIFDDDEEIRRE